MKKTPIQELIEEMKKSPLMYSSGLIAIDILKLEQKEKAFASDCFDAGYSCCMEDLSPDFEQFYSQYEQTKQHDRN